MASDDDLENRRVKCQRKVTERVKEQTVISEPTAQRLKVGIGDGLKSDAGLKYGRQSLPRQEPCINRKEDLQKGKECQTKLIPQCEKRRNNIRVY